MPVDVKKAGFCDGLLGRACRAPRTWHEGSVYLMGFMDGQKKRKEYNITLTINTEDLCK